MLIKKYELGDTGVYFVETNIEGHENAKTVGLAIYPKEYVISDVDELKCDSIIQVAFAGDRNLIDYTQGLTMRNHFSTLVEIVSQSFDGKEIVTVLTDGNKNYYTHKIVFDEKSGVLDMSVEYENRSNEIRVLEMLESFSISGIVAPSRKEPSTCGLKLHRMTAAWSRECRLKSESFSSLGLDMSWARYGVKVEKFGSVGSMPVRNYFPFCAIEDEETGFIISAIMQAPYSWQMEVYKEKESCALSGGLGDYEFARWRKEIKPNETFRTNSAYIRTQMKGGVNGVCNHFLKYMDSLLSVPESEEGMPVLFNEYCTTWGEPSESNIKEILECVKVLPIDYFVIDCGWYLPENCGWCNSPGDWNESKKLFPDGIKSVVNKINSYGYKAGIWFEFEVAGIDSQIYHDESMMIKRDGYPLSSKNRRFLDLRSDKVKDYLQVKMLDFIKNNGFEYVKIDYNDTIGFGCEYDDCISDGEGGRLLMQESLSYIDKLKEKVEGIVIENCSSGGSRIEPLRMSKVSMCSFSDAHECNEIPLVAANVSRVVPARQSQIWAVVRETDTDSRIIYSLCAAMIGRICLSGDIWKLSQDKISIIKQGLEFYKEISDIVRYGEIVDIDCNVEYYREPKGRQIYIKKYGDRMLIIVHKLEDSGDVEIDVSGYEYENSFNDLCYCISDGKLVICDEGNYKAGAFVFRKI